MWGLIDQALRSRANDIGFGMLLGVGLPEYQQGDDLVFSFASKNFRVNPRKPLGVTPLAEEAAHTAMTKGGAFLGVAGFAIAGPIMGFMDNGMAGAIRNTIIESSLNAHMFRHGHTLKPWADAPAAAGGMGYFIGNPGRLLKPFGFAGRVVDYLGRYAVGASMAYGAYDMFGGGPLGFAAAHVAGGIGTKYPKVITGALLAYSGARLAFRGTHAMLKAGYRFKQRQKMVQTDGDMSAFMTQGAFTMRSRAIEAINKSHLNARSALGSEANYFSDASRSYSSPYRRFY
jgi:hypothetical protein